MNWINIWKWPLEVYEDIHQWMVVRKALKEPETIQAFKTFKYELRVDKIGRIYTVVNIPEELWPLEYQNKVWPWMVEQLRELDELLMSRQLNDLVFPEVTPVEGWPSYLVVLTPSTESVSLSKFLSWILRLGFVSVSAILINKIFIKLVGMSIIQSLVSLFA